MAAAASKSSQKAKNVVIALLALWSIVSLIVIVVWATSPDLKSSAQCRAELKEVTVKMEGEKVVFQKDKVALEEKVEAKREENTRQKAEILLLLGQLNTTNATLEECQQENVVLNGTISALQENITQLRETEADLRKELGLQEEHIQFLEHNVTHNILLTETCFSLKAAAESQMLAAQSQTKACEAGQTYLQKQLEKCKEVESESSQHTQKAVPPTPKPAPHDAASPLSGIPALTLLVLSALHLITCEYTRRLRQPRTPRLSQHSVNHSHV